MNWKMNVEELRDELIDVFNCLRDGKIKANDAKGLTNISGKILMSAKIEMDYNKQTNNKRKVQFLEVETAEVIEQPKKKVGRPKKTKD